MMMVMTATSIKRNTLTWNIPLLYTSKGQGQSQLQSICDWVPLALSFQSNESSSPARLLRTLQERNQKSLQLLPVRTH